MISLVGFASFFHNHVGKIVGNSESFFSEKLQSSKQILVNLLQVAVVDWIQVKLQFNL
jgi:hypothetical protein